MTSAYGTFATGGIRHDLHKILRVEDASGNIKEEFRDSSRTVLDKNVALTISDILSDNTARIPTFGANSVLLIPGHRVAVKTGTTNNNRDAWTIGYAPQIVTGVWVGNNDNTPMKKGGVALAGPIWNAFMIEALRDFTDDEFEKPNLSYNPTLPPILRGIWQGGESFFIDKISGKLATDHTPLEAKEERTLTNVHSILYWIDKKDPTTFLLGGNTADSQYEHWEISVTDWWEKNKDTYGAVSQEDIPSSFDDIHLPEKFPKFKIVLSDLNSSYKLGDIVVVKLQNLNSTYPLKQAEIFVNDNFIDVINSEPWTTSFTIDSEDNFSNTNTIKVIVKDVVYNSVTQETAFLVEGGVIETTGCVSGELYNSLTNFCEEISQ